MGYDVLARCRCLLPGVSRALLCPVLATVDSACSPAMPRSLLSAGRPCRRLLAGRRGVRPAMLAPGMSRARPRGRCFVPWYVSFPSTAAAVGPPPCRLLAVASALLD